ncbi:MAG: hypothetical protein CM1200mP2_53340 [Planctomycetaceae bacterium]|nr:MAG: hypothetical protein CM1200mP2_53340 [Planctomycetaceae bacterium]
MSWVGGSESRGLWPMLAFPLDAADVEWVDHGLYATRTGWNRFPVATELLVRFRRLLGDDGVLAAEDELVVYECDGYVVEKKAPDVVLFPTTTEQVSEIVRTCNEFDVPFVPRGAGTSLAGGCLPVGGGVMISLTRMKSILEVNLQDRYAVVQPGLVNLHLTRHLAGTGFHYAPDPSSQGACTIGGNVATNSGGPHTLKYGVTVNHVLGLEVVMPDGQVVEFGGVAEGLAGYDLVGLFVGSEGTFGICTQVTVRLTRNPERTGRCWASSRRSAMPPRPSARSSRRALFRRHSK